jgi:hypothetical protein
MNARSGREPLVPFRPYVALLVLSALCLCAWGADDWAARPSTPHGVAGTPYSCSDMVCVKHCESLYIFLYTDSTGYGGNYSFLNAYSPQLGTWSGDLPAPPFAYTVALAYARDANRMYAVGYFPDNGGSRFYTYVFNTPSGYTGTWSSEALPFNLYPSAPGHGYTRMTYRRNRYLAPLYAIPGWLYAIGYGSGYDDYVYRYPIPNPGDAAVDGYNPGNTAAIADATPHFVWPSVSGALEYRIIVSSESTFSSAEMDMVTVDTTFQVPAALPLANGQHYWQIQSFDEQGGWATGPVLQFSLSAGWERIATIPMVPGDLPSMAATLVYTCMGSGSAKAESLMYNGAHYASYGDSAIYLYSIHNGTWDTAFTLPYNPSSDGQNYMMAAATSELSLEESKQIYAVLDTLDTVCHHWKLDLELQPARWRSLQAVAPFPVRTSYFCRLVYDAELDSLYATVGNGETLFYARWTGGDPNGQQAGTGGRVCPRLSATPVGGVLIRYFLSAPERARLDVFDPVGRKVLSRDLGEQAAGEHSVRVAQSSLGAHAGILLLRLTHGNVTERAKVVLF